MKAQHLLWLLWLIAPPQNLYVQSAVTVSYNASTLVELQAAARQVALDAAYNSLHHQLAAIYVHASIDVSASNTPARAAIAITTSVTIRGVLQPDGTWPTLDCGGAQMSAITITGDEVEVADLHFQSCYFTAIVVRPAKPDYTYLFSNLWFEDNTVPAGTSGGGGLTFGGSHPATATLINCTFFNNISPLDQGSSGAAAALSGGYGNFTLTDCTFVENSNLTQTHPVIMFQAVSLVSVASDYYDYVGDPRASQSYGGSSGYAYASPPPPLAAGPAFTLVMDGLTFVNNSGTRPGKDVYPSALVMILQAKLYPSDVCSVTVRNSLLANNSGNMVLMVSNPQGNRQQKGVLGCATVVEDTVFQGNSLGAGYYSLYGGLVQSNAKLWSFKGQSSVTLTRVLVSSNVDVESFLSLSHVDASVITDCTFSDNVVSSSGLHLHLHSSSTFDMEGCLLDGNSLSPTSATTGGAAMYIESGMHSLTVKTCNFTNNGGGAYGGAVNVAAAVSSFNFMDSLFANNTALLGGGAMFYQASTLTLQQATVWNCVFSGNFAAYGGAVVSSTANTLAFWYCTFEDNVAASGGAVVISNNVQHQTFETCNFTMNRAEEALASSSDEVLYQYACGPGGGGALCIVGSGLNSLANVACDRCILTNNSATFGGAIYVGQGTSCSVLQKVPRGPVPCYRLGLFNCALDNNTAVGGAGGAIFLHDQGIISNWCTSEQGNWTEELAPKGLVLNDTQPASDPGGSGFDYTEITLRDGSLVQPSMQQLPCRSWLGNSIADGAYGPLMATPPLNATLMAPMTPTSLISPDLVPVLLNVTDWYGQLVTSTRTPVISVATLTPARPASELYDALVVQADQGIVNMSSLRLQATPGPHIVTVTVSQSAPSIALLATFYFEIEVSPCPPDYYANADHNQCAKYTRCRAGSYTTNVSSQECQLCPANAACNDPNIGGGAIVPNAGFWHSHPLSAEIHPCDNVVACAARDRSLRLAAAQEVFTNASLFGENVTDMLTTYMSELCADEYQGGSVLCGGCSNGFGHVAGITCKKCLPRKEVIAIHIVLTLVTLAFILLTIRSSLATALWTRPDGPTLPLHAAPSLSSLPSAGRGLPSIHRHKISNGTRYQDADAAGHWSQAPASPPPGSPRLFDDRLSKAGASDLAQGAAVDVTDLSKGQAGKVSTGQLKLTKSLQHAVDALPETTVLSKLVQGSADGKNALHGPAVDSHTRAAHAGGIILGEGLDEEEEPQHSTIILILVSYLQVLAMPRRIPLLWPNMLIQMLNAASMVTSAAGSLASFECFVTQGQRVMQIIQVSMIQILEPVVMMAVITTFFLARVAVKQRMGDLKIPVAWYLKRRLILSACVIVFYVYPAITDVIIGSFACQVVDTAAGIGALEAQGYEVLSGSVGTFWREELNQLCYSGQHWIQFWVIGVPGLILFAAGVPLVCLYFLWYHRHDLQKHSFQASWGFLYEEFQPGCFYWEVLGESRKLLIITIISVVSSSRPGLQLLASLGVLVAACLAQVFMRPYRSHAMNRLETISLLALLITFWLLTFFVVIPGVSPAATTALAVLITVINASTVLWLLACLLAEVWKAVQSQPTLHRTASASFMQLLSRSASSMRAVAQAVPCCTSPGETLYSQATPMRASGRSTIGSVASNASALQMQSGTISGIGHDSSLTKRGDDPALTVLSTVESTAGVLLPSQGAAVMIELATRPQEATL